MGGGGGKGGGDDAADAQIAALERQIQEQRAAFNYGKNTLDPYLQAGMGGLNSYLALLGQNGGQAQQQAIQGLEQTPGYQSQLQAGQRAVLQNASATGGLRGGNVQQGLAEFGSGLFGQYYQNQLERLNQLQNQGLQTGMGLANLRAGNAAQIGNAMANIGQAQGQSILAQQAQRQQGAQGLGSALGAGAGFLFGGPAGAVLGTGIGGGLGGFLGK